MKEGTTDPFADDDLSDDQASQTGQSDSTAEPKETADTSSKQPTDSTPESTTNTTPSGGNTGQYDRSDLPRILTRDKVKDDRDDVHQLFVYEDTHEKEKEARRELEDRLGDDIYKLDVREAIYRAGMENLDDAEDIPREWGADI